MMGERRGLILFVLLAVALAMAVPANAYVQVKYYTLKYLESPAGSGTYVAGGDAFSVNLLNIAHAMVSGGIGDADRNGDGSVLAKINSTYPWSQYPTTSPFTRKANGMGDGLEFSVFEYIYATPTAPRHAEAVAAFNTNDQLLINYSDQHPVFGVDPNRRGSFLYAFASQDSADIGVARFTTGIPAGATQAQIQAAHDARLRNAQYLQTLAHITVSEHLTVVGNSLWVDIGLSGAGAATQSAIPDGADWTTDLIYLPGYGMDNVDKTPVIDILTSMPGLDRTMVNYLKPSADFDGDGYTNQAEYDRIMANMITENAITIPAGTVDKFGYMPSREKKDEFIGRYITSAILDNIGAGIHIENGPALIGFSPKTYTVSEGAGSVTVTVTLDAAPGTGNTVTVNYATSNGTAIAASDYTAVTSGALSFTGSEVSKTFQVAILNDALTEGTETFTVTLSGNSTNSQLDSSASTATITITDDDMDTDHDGLQDNVETNDGVFNPPTSYGTDPNNPDTNGDGVSDGLAVTFGYNPNTDDLAGQLPVVQYGGIAAIVLVLAGTGVVLVRRRRRLS